MYARKRRPEHKPNGVVERQHDGDGATGGEAYGERYGIGDAIFTGQRSLSNADLSRHGDFNFHLSLPKSNDERRWRRSDSGNGIERRRADVAEHVGANGAVDEHGERLRQGRRLRIEAVRRRRVED